jgi:predicted ATP-binding protein involved in virulence
MYIRELQAYKFRNFEDEKFIFNTQFTVVIGDNGMGKSSLIHALQAALGAYLQCLPIPASRVYRRQIKPGEIRVTWDSVLKEYTSSKENTCIFSKAVLNDTEVEWRRVMLNKRTTSHNRLDTGQLIDAVDELLKLRDEKKNIALPVIANFSTVRAATQQRKGAKAQTKRSRLEKGYLAALSDNSDFEGLIEWLHNYDGNLKHQKEFSGTKEAIFNAITTAIPFLTDVEYNSYYKELEAVVTINEKNSGKITHSNMSDGLKAMLNLVSELAFRCVILNGFLGADSVVQSKGVVLIDELDMHLHPTWQKRVIGDLKKAFPNIQFIVTTHSPFIVQSLSKEELQNLDFMTPENPSDMTLNKVVTDVMGVTKLKSDDFEERYKIAFQQFQQLNRNFDELSMDDYQRVKEAIDKIVVEETNDPIYKAFLKAKGE